jgi:hypothetical protein
VRSDVHDQSVFHDVHVLGSRRARRTAAVAVPLLVTPGCSGGSADMRERWRAGWRRGDGHPCAGQLEPAWPDSVLDPTAFRPNAGGHLTVFLDKVPTR